MLIVGIKSACGLFERPVREFLHVFHFRHRIRSPLSVKAFYITHEPFSLAVGSANYETRCVFRKNFELVARLS